jgi:hypothetical protein
MAEAGNCGADQNVDEFFLFMISDGVKALVPWILHDGWTWI